MTTEIPRVDFNDATKPSNIGVGDSVLVYEELHPATSMLLETSSERAALAWESQPGSMEELETVRQLALQGFVQTAARLIETPGLGDRDLWASRFTEASVELYGEPEKEEVERLLSGELYFLEHISGLENFDQANVELLKDVYRRELFRDEGLKFVVEVADEAMKKDAIFGFGEILKQRYGYIFDLIDDSEEKMYTPADLLGLFENSLSLLKQNETGWDEWVIVERPNSTMLSVNATHKRINIPMKREAATSSEARGLLGHELLVHALRAKNGYATSENYMGQGLPGFLDAEEGLGIMVEHGLSGELPAKAYDRYVDVALALGTLTGRQYGRSELALISYARQALRLQLADKLDEASARALKAKVQTHVDRIFRGTPGDDQGNVYGVYTKDISYYEGYRSMTDYIVNELKKGRSLDDIYDHIAIGRYDPTNAHHLQYMSSRNLV